MFPYLFTQSEHYPKGRCYKYHQSFVCRRIHIGRHWITVCTQNITYTEIVAHNKEACNASSFDTCN